MTWKYKVVKDEDLYYIAQVFYNDSLIMAVNDAPDLSIDSTTIPQAKEGEDKELVRALVALLYEMIDDIKQTEVITIEEVKELLNDSSFIN
tara:strand:+ start:199 stop:471 length:273 start_codon:yes stop_codon:yes gene_type:complete